MQLISSSAFDYSSIRMEALFTEMIDLFTESGNRVVSGPVDALEQAAAGNGEWGICDGGEEDGIGIWVLAEEGTLVLYSSGAIAKLDFEFDETEVESDDKYDLFYHLLSQFLPEDIIPEKLPFDEDAEAERLSNAVTDDDDLDDGEEDE